VTNAPIFFHDEIFFGEGIVGGPMQVVAGQTKKAAEVVLRILTVKRLATSNRLSLNWRRPCWIGDKCNVGELPRAICRPAAPSISASLRCGNGIGGRSRSSLPWFWRRLALSRACCASIVGVNSPKYSRGSALRNLPMSIASPPLANLPLQLRTKLTNRLALF